MIRNICINNYYITLQRRSDISAVAAWVCTMYIIYVVINGNRILTATTRVDDTVVDK